MLLSSQLAISLSFGSQRSSCNRSLTVEVALERLLAGEMSGLRARQVERDGSDELDIGACRIEVDIAQADLPCPEQAREQNPLRGAPLVDRDHEQEPGQLATTPSKRSYERAPAS